MKVPVGIFLGSCLAALPAFASSGFTPLGGDVGGSFHAMPSNTTRAEVLTELAAWRRRLVTSDGWRQSEREGGGDWGFAEQATPAKTRTQVARELDEFRRNPASADGWTFVGGEAGWVEGGRGAQRATAEPLARR